MRKKNILIAILMMIVGAVILLGSCSDSGNQIDTMPVQSSDNNSEVTTESPSSTTQTEETKMFSLYGEYDAVFPKPEQREKLYIVQSVPQSSDDLLTLVSLQGLLARNSKSGIIIEYDSSVKSYTSMLRSYYSDVCKMTYSSGLWSTVSSEIDSVDGYILTDRGDDSINVANSLAAQLNAIIVTENNRAAAENRGLKCLLDVSDKDDAWLRQSEYWDKLDKDIAFMINTGYTEHLRDYAIFCGSYVFSDSDDTPKKLTDRVGHMNDNFIVFGWNTACGEFDTVKTFASINGSIIASDFAKNLSALSAFSLNEAHQKTEAAESASADKHTVCFVISDGDNLQWTLNDFQTSDKWWANKKRGDFYTGWGLPASMIDVAPAALQYYYRTMKETDEFIMQLSGIGYTFPSYWRSISALRSMQEQLASLMGRAGMSVMEILDDAKLNDTLVQRYYSGFLDHEEIDGILYIDYSNYAGYGGQIFWSNDKPIVAARHRVWAGFTDVTQLASEINRASTDPSSEDAYSFIIVHAWSGLDSKGNIVANGNTLDAVAAIVEKLDPDVEVVTPSELIKRITENVSHD